MDENLRGQGPRASKRLEESEEKYRHLIEEISDGYVVLKGERIVFANRRCGEISGYALGEFVGQPPTRFVAPEVLEQALELFRSSMRGEEAPQRLETVLIHQDGTRVPVEISSRDIIYEGSPAVSAIIRDITERKRAEEALRESEEKLRRMFEAIGDGIAVTDLEGNIVEVNDAVLSMSGSSKEELIGQNAFEFIAEKDHVRVMEDMKKLLEEGRSGIAELTLLTAEGREFDGEVRVAMLCDSSGNPAGFINVLRDVTKRKQAEEERALLYQEIGEKVERLAVTANLTKIIVSRLDIEEVFDAFAAETRKLVDAAQIGIDIVEGEKVRVFAVSSEAEEGVKAGGFLPLMGSATEWVWKNKRSIVEADLAQRRQFASDEMYFQEGLRSAIYIPLFSRGEVFGTFYLLSCRPNAYGEREVETLEELAGQIAVAIENDRLYQEAKERAEQIAMTSQLTRLIGSSLDIKEVYQGFTSRLRDIVDFDRASIALVEGENLRLIAVSSEKETKLGGGAVVPLKDSATAWAVANKRTNIERDLGQMRRFPLDETLLKEGLRSAIRLPLLSKGEVFGTFNLASRYPDAYGEREQQILEEIAGQIAIAVENDRLYQEVKERKDELETAYRQLMSSATALEKSKQELEDAYLQVAKTLVLTLEARDPYTRGHSERVAQFVRQIALEMGLSQEEMKKLETAARLHDLGKIGIPDGILLKPSAITPVERAEIQLHPIKSVELLRFLGFMDGVLPIIEGHHERYNGRGYPSSLKGEETPLGARILAVADAYDAMTSARPYRPPMTSEQAMEALKHGAGTQWDPEVVEAFLRAFSG